MAEAGSVIAAEGEQFPTCKRQVTTMKSAEQADVVWQRAPSQPARSTCLYAGRRHDNLRTYIVPHDRALLPQTKLFVADAIDCRVSARLAARRRRVGIDRALLDLLLDARDGTVERLETGRSRIAPSRLLQLASILDVPIKWFFDEAESETPPAEPVFARGGEKQAEARRFLAFYARIADPKVRAEIREMVRSLAVASSQPVAPKLSASIPVRPA